MNHKTHGTDRDIAPDDDATQNLRSSSKRDAVSQYWPRSVVSVAQDVADSKCAFGAHRDITDDDRSYVVYPESRPNLGTRTDLDVRQDLGEKNHRPVYRTKRASGGCRRLEYGLTKPVDSDRPKRTLRKPRVSGVPCTIGFEACQWRWLLYLVWHCPKVATSVASSAF